MSKANKGLSTGVLTTFSEVQIFHKHISLNPLTALPFSFQFLVSTLDIYASIKCIQMSSHILLAKILNVHVCELYGINHYRLQGKVMFSEACVILSTQVVSILPPLPLDRDPPLDRHSLETKNPGYWHLVATTAAVGTLSTGMHSC